jgi:glycosyltransferase involved in cell wall biosynthesis
VVLFLGRLVPKKSPDLLIKAFAASCNGDQELRSALLVVAGAEEDLTYRSRLETLTAQLGISERVSFTGPLYGEVKWAAYRDADVFVLPSQHENFGNTAAEAMACGTPVIITDCCGIAPLVNHRAGLVVPYNQKSLEEALGRLLRDESLRIKFGEAGRGLARELSWQRPVEIMEDIYRSLLLRRS